MKKRVLSLLLACFMVVSTFIISKPLVHVHAVDNEQYVEGENMWTLPENFRPDTLDTFDEYGWPIVGNYRLRSYAYNGYSDLRVNYGAVKNFGSTGSTAPAWWINPEGQGQSEQFSSNGTDPGMRVNPFNSAAAIVFTAPSAGIYEYSQLVKQLWFETTAGDRTTTVSYQVVKNGVIYASFTPDPNQAAGELKGYIALNEGDELIFVCTKVFDNLSFTNNDGDWARGYMGALIESIVMKKVSNLPDGYTGDTVYTANFDVAGILAQGAAETKDYSVISNSNFTIMGYDYLAKKAIAVSNIKQIPNWNATKQLGAVYATIQNTDVQLFTTDGTNPIFTADVGGKNANRARAVAFTAPEEGYYSLQMTGKTDWVWSLKSTSGNAGNFVQYEVIDDNGNVLNYAIAYDNSDRGTSDLSGPYVTVATQVYLKAGQTAYIVSRDADLMPAKCAGGDGSSIKSITAVKTAGPAVASNDKELNFVFNGTSFTDKTGTIEMKGYDMTTGTLYGAENNVEMVIEGDRWYAYDHSGKNTWQGGGAKENYLWSGLVSTGKIDKVGGHLCNKNVGFALVFTAPNDGTYDIYANLGWDYINQSTYDFVLKKADGTVLDSWTNTGVNANRTSYRLAELSLELKKGEQVIVMKTLSATQPEEGHPNQSNNGEASIKIVEHNHVCANSVKYIEAETSCLQPGYKAHYACTCGVNYADANATTVFDGDVVIPKEDHVTPEVYGQSQTEHWQVCANGCGTELARAAHTWDNGVCTVCAYACQHEWNAETGTCTNCGLGCAHTVTADDATCVSEAVCTNCGYTYAKNPNNHIDDISVVTGGNGDGTHNWICNGCHEVLVSNEKCTYDENHVCIKCNYNNKPNVINEATNKVDSIISTILGEGTTTDIEAVGPTAPMDSAFDVTKPAIAPAGYEFKYLNIYFGENDSVVLRMSFVVNGEVNVTLNGDAVTLKQDEGYNTYYLDITPVAGQYDVANVVTVNGDTYNVSLYSYIKLALEGTDVGLTDAEETLLRALYDLNELMR